MQTYLVLAPAVAPLLEYDPNGNLSSVTTRLFKELETFLEGYELTYFQTENQFAKMQW
jgi:hypothetical protein